MNINEWIVIYKGTIKMEMGYYKIHNNGKKGGPLVA